MGKKSIIDLSLRMTQVSHSGTDFIDGDVLLSDRLNKDSMPTSPHRMTFILVALCTKGECTFTVDTQQLTIRKNDVVIISDRHIVDNFQSSDDADGLVMILSVNFFYEVVRNVSDVSMLFCFSRKHPVVSLTDNEVELFRSYLHAQGENAGYGQQVSPRHSADAYPCHVLRPEQRYSTTTGVGKQKADTCRQYFHSVHKTRGTEFSQRAQGWMVCGATLHHSKISFGNCEEREQPNAKRMDRQLCVA